MATITTEQQVELTVSAVTPEGNKPPRPLTWTVSDPTKLALAFKGGQNNVVTVLGLAVGGGLTVTADDGVLAPLVFPFTVVSPDATALAGVEGTPERQDDLNRNRGRGHGIGYL